MALGHMERQEGVCGGFDPSEAAAAVSTEGTERAAATGGFGPLAAAASAGRVAGAASGDAGLLTTAVPAEATAVTQEASAAVGLLVPAPSAENSAAATAVAAASAGWGQPPVTVPAEAAGPLGGPEAGEASDADLLETMREQCTCPITLVSALLRMYNSRDSGSSID